MLGVTVTFKIYGGFKFLTTKATSESLAAAAMPHLNVSQQKVGRFEGLITAFVATMIDPDGLVIVILVQKL